MADTEDLIAAARQKIRDTVFESEDVADHVHATAADAAARRIVHMVLREQSKSSKAPSPS